MPNNTKNVTDYSDELEKQQEALKEEKKKLPGKQQKSPRGGAKNSTREFLDYDDLDDV